MTQGNLFKRPARSTSVVSQTDKLAAKNLESARIILANIERNGGEGSISVVWARLVLGKSGQLVLQEAA